MRQRILEAAIRVLRDEGALGFTTTRVADEAQVSVGSLYQYFPNKHALVVAIHHESAQAGWEHIRSVLDDPGRSPRDKVVDIARWFFATESAEADEMGAVFEDVEVFLRDRPDDKLDHDALLRFRQFVVEATGRRSRARVDFDAKLLMTTLESMGKTLAGQPLTVAERDRWATATATMLCDHLGIH